MKKTGFAIIIIGLIFTIITGFKFFTREKIMDVGSLKVTASMPHRVVWSPYLGVGIMIVGGVVLIFGKKN
jgi:hypothetical protein